MEVEKVRPLTLTDQVSGTKRCTVMNPQAKPGKDNR
jgi:hypothetical protein